MTHWNRPRGLTSDQRLTTADRLDAIAAQLRADHAGTVQANLAAWADPTPWPTSTGAAGGGSGPSSPVEHAIDIETGSTTMARAARLLHQLHQLHQLASDINHGLAEANPHRIVAYCPNPKCGRAVLPGERCTSCSTRQQAEPTCDDCGKPEDRHGMRSWPTTSWTGWADGVTRTLCLTDWMWRWRHDGRPRNGIERLALGDGVLVEAGGEHTPGV